MVGHMHISIGTFVLHCAFVGARLSVSMTHVRPHLTRSVPVRSVSATTILAATRLIIPTLQVVLVLSSTAAVMCWP